MTIALLHSAKAATSAASVTSLACTVTSTTLGNLLLAGVAHTSTSTTLSAPAGWVQLGTTLVGSRSTALFAYVANPGSITSISFGSTASGGMSVIVAEFSGCPMNFALDVAVATNNNTSGTTTMDSGTSATTNYAAELWFAILEYGASTVKTISAVTNSFSTDQVTADGSSSGGTFVRMSDYYKVVSSTGTANVEATLSGSSNWQGMICTLSPIAAASGGGAGGALPTGQFSSVVNAGGSGGDTSGAEFDSTVATGGAGGATPAGQFSAASNAGGAGGSSPGAQFAALANIGGAGGDVPQGAFSVSGATGGAGGSVPAGQYSATADVGGSGGDAANGQFAALVSAGGSGGISPMGLFMILVAVGGLGGAAVSALLVALASVGGAGGVSGIPPETIVVLPYFRGGMIASAADEAPAFASVAGNAQIASSTSGSASIISERDT